MKKLNALVVGLSIILTGLFLSCSTPSTGPSKAYEITKAPYDLVARQASKANTYEISWSAATEKNNSNLYYDLYYGSENDFSKANIINYVANSRTCTATVTFPSILDVENETTKKETKYFWVKAYISSESAVSNVLSTEITYTQVPVPTNVKCTKTFPAAGEVSYFVTWDKVNNADGYIIYEKKDTSSEWKYYETVSSPSFSNENLNSSVYGNTTYAVKAYQYITSALRTSSVQYNESKKVIATIN